MNSGRGAGWSGSGLPEPQEITNAEQLAAALKAVKGERSYAQLETVAERLVRRSSARGGAAGEPWSFEPLRRGSVSDWLLGRGLPTRNKLRTFLAVCDVPTDQWDVWVDAVGRARRAASGRAITDHDPLLLGVHPAIHILGCADGGRELDVLTPYVVRNHDHQLRETLRTGQTHQMVMLVGGSSVGKSRACVEAVRQVLPGWPVIHPGNAEELLTVLEHDLVAGTVLWLNEAQRYLQPPHGSDVAIALRRLLAKGAETPVDRVVVLGSMWLDPYWRTFTRQPQNADEPDIHEQVRELLTLPGVRIRVAEDFSTATNSQRAELEKLAAHDLRLATALAVGGEPLRITQTLAGGPLLVDHYNDVAGTPAHAVLTAAMDARRIGCEAPLPAALLEQAASGYLTPEQRAATAGWLPAALTVAAEEIHGVRALTPVRTAETIGAADGYLLHDFLVQHALSNRRRKLIPASLWDAVTTCVADPDDLRRVAENAHIRGLVTYSVPINRTLANAGDQHAAEWLAAQGDEAAVAQLRTRADAGDRHSARLLARLLARQGDHEGAVQVWAQAYGDRSSPTTKRLVELLTEQGNYKAAAWWWESSNPVWQDEDAVRPRDDWDEWADDWGVDEQADFAFATLVAESTRLAELLAARGDDAAVAELRARADAGDRPAAERLAGLLAEQGDHEGVVQLWRARADVGDRPAAERLAGLLAEQGDHEGVVQLWRARVDAGYWGAAERLAGLLVELGDHEGATQLWRARADAGDRYAAGQLAELLAEQGDEAALAELRTRAADADDWHAAERLAELLAGRGDDAAAAELRARADAGHRHAAERLAELLAGRGDDAAVAELRARADAGCRPAAQRLAGLLAEQGDREGAAQVWRARADAGDWHAVVRLAGLLAEQGDYEGATQLWRARADAGDRYAAGQLAEQGDDAAVAELRTRAADADDWHAAVRLAGLLAGRGDDAAVAELRVRADAGDWHAAVRLAELLAEQGDHKGAAQVWRTRADAGDRDATTRLTELLVGQGDWNGVVQLWRTMADAGDRYTAGQLAELLAGQGDLDSLRHEVYAGNTRHAAEALISFFAAGDSQRISVLNRYGLTVTGDPKPIHFVAEQPNSVSRTILKTEQEPIDEDS